MWKEIQVNFDIQEGANYLKMQAFVVDTIQRLYRLWKSCLHYYYKSEKCGETDEEHLENPPPDMPPEQWEYCVKRFSSLEFKAMSARNSKNRLSIKRCTHTTENLSFAELEDVLEKLKNVVATSGDTKSEEEILLEVLLARSGYFREKGTTTRPFTKGRQQLQQQIMDEQRKKI